MSSESLRDAYRAFTTTCALITTNGPRGPNVMAAEWTFNVSYDPFLILIAIDPENRTHDMIRESGEFGVNLVTEEQIAAMGFAGHYSKSETDKLSSELFETVPARTIKAPMLKGSLLNAECRLVREVPLGDHTGFLGEVVSFSADPEGWPIVLHHGSHRVGDRITRQPGIVVAVTPMETDPGKELLVSGELARPIQSADPVTIELHDPDGAIVATASTQSSPHGGFQAPLAVPSTARPGGYRLVARTAGSEGGARLLVR